jgi:lipoprotein-anchoring transpeptidase ErfK/SrfK
MKRSIVVLILILMALGLGACVANTPRTGTTTVQPSPSPSAEKPKSASTARSQVTLPVLDALLASDDFVNELKTKLELTSEQIQGLKKVAGAEVDRLRSMNAEQSDVTAVEQDSRGTDQIASVIGNDKVDQLATLTNEFWARGEVPEQTAEKLVLPDQPNSIPSDTRIVVNIPAYRMDLFRDGSLVKSYKIGIGYPEFPLPQGVRKAQTIIFNPTWTPPDSPWVAKMNVTPGEKVEAGSKLNPLGPIKIPIGMPSLIHGGKSPAKLGTFASHGCVGLTNAQVKDFARMLGSIAGTELSENSISSYLKNPTQTKVVKLSQMIPVELRYETIVLVDGKLHVYKDVYRQETNTEANLRSVLEANGSSLEDLSEEERTQALNAINAMSTHPTKTAVATPTATPSPEKGKQRVAKKSPKNQKEVVIELTNLASRGYPAPVNFDDGSGKAASVVATR